ncbi:putative aspartic-type endopeptidase OPSB [Cytospora mali]|uniref:Aspartic-type endopeptidase OPSB n=1 Tax=Cytospora mali TaxID=578113 RepID=A0A194USW2_CYTMA|nr:putative aspartic-type endopeptidase OPSB [Valsa mali var. pyri (nom. inval.)]
MKTSIRLVLIIGNFIQATTALVQFPFAKHANTAHKSVASTSRRAVNTGLFWGDLTYVVNASIGTPGQSVSLVLSTSSSTTWVLDSRSETCDEYSDYSSYADEGDEDYNNTDITSTTYCVWGTFSSNQSSTYESQGTSDNDDYYYDYDFTLSYTDGSYADGEYFNDTITLDGGATVSDFTLGLVNETNMYIGVLGIGYNDSIYSNLPNRLQEQGLINSTAYSIWVDDEKASSGNLLFGAIDTTKFDGSLARVSSSYYNSMAIHIASINGTTSDSGGPIAITYTDSDDDSSSSSYSYSDDYLFTATFSPPDTVSYLPGEVASQIWDIAGAYYDTDAELALISCNATDDTATNFTLQLGEGIYGPIITATMADLVIPREDLNLTYYSAYIPYDNSTCLFGVQNGSLSYNYYSTVAFSLGSTLLRRTYSVFDLVNDEIAVAPVKFGATATSNIVPFATYGASVPSSTMHCVYSDCYETSDGTDDSEAGTLPSGVLSVPALVGMSLGIGIGALLLGTVGLLVWRRRLNNKKAGAKDASAASAEAGAAAPPLMTPSNAAGVSEAAPEMTEVASPSAVGGGKGKEPEVPAPEASGSAVEHPEASTAAEAGNAHDAEAGHDADAGHASSSREV